MQLCGFALPGLETLTAFAYLSFLVRRVNDLALQLYRLAPRLAMRFEKLVEQHRVQ